MYILISTVVIYSSCINAHLHADKYEEFELIAERISAGQLIRVHISANTYVREVTLRNFISHAQTSGSHA